MRNPAPPPREQDVANGARHAHRNIDQRLAFAYGERARMTGCWNEGYYQAEFRVPLGGEAAK